MAAKLSPMSVHLRPAASPTAPKRCGTCIMHRPPGRCTLVFGKPGDHPIESWMVCDRFAPKTRSQ
jgi:hypothetical protein